MRCLALSSLVAALVAIGIAPARADDASDGLRKAIQIAEERVASDAEAVDAALAGRDFASWAKAHDKFLASVDDSLRGLEQQATAAVRTGASGDSVEGALHDLAKSLARLSQARAMYFAFALRARSLDAGKSRDEAFSHFSLQAKDLLAVPSGMELNEKRAAEEVRDRQAAWERRAIQESKDHLSALLKYYIAAGCGMSKPWPAFTGKRFVLWLVATNQISKRDATQLATLFSPVDGLRSFEKAGGVRAYEAVTLERLRTEDESLLALTSYAGRRNREKEHLLSASELERGAPCIADLQFRDVAIVGFVNGQVKVMTKADLGLKPEDLIFAGDASKSDVLRDLSED